MIEAIIGTVYLIAVVWLCLHTVWKAFGVKPVRKRGVAWKWIVVLGLFAIVALSLAGLAEFALFFVALA